MKKLSELDREAGRRALLDGNFAGMTRESAFAGYVEGVLQQSFGEVDWKDLIRDVDQISAQRRKSRAAPASGVEVGLAAVGASRAESVIAAAWAREDLNASMSWFVEDLGKDISNDGDARRVGAVFAELPFQSRSGVADWLEGHGEEGGRVATHYLKNLAETAALLGPDLERAIRLVPEELERWMLVLRFLERSEASSKEVQNGKSWQPLFSQKELSSLVRNAELSTEFQSILLKQIQPAK